MPTDFFSSVQHGRELRTKLYVRPTSNNLAEAENILLLVHDVTFTKHAGRKNPSVLTKQIYRTYGRYEPEAN